MDPAPPITYVRLSVRCDSSLLVFYLAAASLTAVRSPPPKRKVVICPDSDDADVEKTAARHSKMGHGEEFHTPKVISPLGYQL